MYEYTPWKFFRFRISFLWLFILINLGNTRAQHTKVLTMEDAVRQVIESNPLAKNASVENRSIQPG